MTSPKFPALPKVDPLPSGSMTPTITYIPPSLSSTLATLPVLGIKAAAHPPDNVSNGKKTNHWVLHLQISQTGSVRLDISPTGVSTGAGCLIVRKLDYIVSSNAVKTYDLAVRGGLTVKSILDCLQSEHKDRFRFTSSGQGCRFWVDSLLALLRQRQITTVGSETQTARAALQRVWGLGGQLVPAASQTPIMQGTFY